MLLWTLKESAVKARGEALPPLLNKVLFSRQPRAGQPAQLTTESPGSYLLLDPVPGYRVALCWLGEAGASPDLRLYHWQGDAAAREAEPCLRGAT